MDQIFSSILNFRKKIELLLDNDLSKNIEESEVIKKNFQESRDLNLIRSLSTGLPDDHTDRAIAIFSRLSYLFEAGVFFENFDGDFKVQAYFHRGVLEPMRIDPRPITKLPFVNLMTVLSTKSPAILEKIKLTELDPNGEGTALLLKLTPDFSFLLISQLPDIWLKAHVEKVLSALHLGISES